MKGYHFIAKDRRLGYGDGRLAEVGVTHKVTCKPMLCYAGLHASERVIDALQYAPGPVVARVELGGDIVKGDDKAVATERTYLNIIDATDTLRHFARLCALDVIDLWKAPDVVRQYLETGDESMREAAQDAAWDAALDASLDASWNAAADAARTAAQYAAWDAARTAAQDAAWTVERTATRTATRTAARAAARAAVRDAQNTRLKTMLQEAGL